MNILLIAPHPFLEERGSPIAVKLMVETLCGIGHKVDLLTYSEGIDISVNGLTINRIRKIFFLKNIPIGFSWKKVIADIFIIFSLIRLVFKNKYDVIHAVEESIFPAVVLNFFLKKKLIYDMDSSLADQLIEKYGFLKRYQKLFDNFEAYAVRHADILIPVCKYLGDKIKNYNPRGKIFILEDIAFVKNGIDVEENLREKFRLNGIVAMYVGNLEYYQGIDLMLKSIAKVDTQSSFSVIIIGGKQDDILKYQEVSKSLNICNKVYFIGPRGFMKLPYYLCQADILISPRIKGKNTPMKLYSYLASGKPVLATKVDSHVQVIDNTNSKLADPDPDSFAKALQELIENKEMRNNIGQAGNTLAQNNYSLASYKEKLNNIYERLS